uniref:Putative ovule protein n=1 Tax=Solanum chacoense TaxID=4108 RepID=A0A0V0H0U1_SOLCH
MKNCGKFKGPLMCLTIFFITYYGIRVAKLANENMTDPSLGGPFCHANSAHQKLGRIWDNYVAQIDPCGIFSKYF